MSDNTFELVRATTADKEKVSTCAATCYHPDEPLNQAILKITNKMDFPVEEDIEYVLQYLEEGYSLLAVRGDEVIGMAITREIDSDNRDKLIESINGTDSVDAKLAYEFFLHVEREAGFRAEGDPERILELHILTVAMSARGQGVGKALIEGSLQVARDHGFKLFRMDTTGLYSARLVESCGLKCIYSINYQDYKNDNGEVIFNVSEPHKEYKVFKKYL